MQAEDIDIIAEAFLNMDFETVCRYGDIDYQVFQIAFQEFRQQREENFNELSEKIYANIIQKIQKGDWQYFLDVIQNDKESPLRELALRTTDSRLIDILMNKRQEFGWDEFELTRLILAKNNQEYILSCIEDSENLGLSLYNVSKLVLQIQDREYIKSFIAKNEDALINGNKDELIKLIVATKDESYIMRYIDDRDNLKFNPKQTKDLILGTGKEEYIISCINDRNKFNLTISQVKELILSRSDEYIESCLAEPEKMGIDMDIVVNLLLDTDKIKYIPQYVARGKELGIEPDNLKKLIAKTQDVEYIRTCIEDREQLGIDATTLTDMILLTGNLAYIEECKQNAAEFHLDQPNLDRLKVFSQACKIDLPPEMTIGVEIEAEGEKNRQTTLRGLLGKTGLNWSAKDDGSLIDGGTEVVSPVLKGDNPQNADEIRTICAVLDGFGQVAGEKCGGHIHIGADYLTSKEDWVNLIEIFGNAEKVLYIISNEAGELPRNGVSQYASPISKRMQEAIDKGTVNLDGEESLDDFVKSISGLQDKSKYSGINFLNVGQSGKNTIEFRLANGTINPNTWIQNINLFGGIVRSSHELSQIQAKPEEQRTESERRKVEALETLLTEQDEEKILTALLELCISPEQRQVYMERYTVNKALLQDEPGRENAITRNTSTSKIGKKVFTGKDAINGVQYQEEASRIEQELARSEIQQGVELGG